MCRPWPEQRLEPELRSAQSSAGAPGLLDSLACCNDTGDWRRQPRKPGPTPALLYLSVSHGVRPWARDSQCCIRHCVADARRVCRPRPRESTFQDNMRDQPRKTTQHTDSHHTCRDRQHRPRAGWASQILAATCRISGRTHPTYTASRNRERPLRPVYLCINGVPHAFCG